MSIPNILTMLRFILIPVFAYTYIVLDSVPLSATILALSGITDFLDGFIARRFNMITKWGIVFDPIADKLTLITVALCISLSGIKFMWALFGFLVFKELLMILGGINLYKKGDVVVPANWYGKAATILFYLLFFMLIIFGGNLNEAAKNAMIFISIALGVFALIRYSMLFFVMKRTLK